MSRISEVAGVILAGGRSLRFGENKAFARFRGQLLIERVLEAMQLVFEELMIVTNTPKIYTPLGVRVLHDLVPYQGPLGGIVTALRGTGQPHIFAVACDMPVLESATIRAIVDRGRAFNAAIPVHAGIREYLMALYSRRLLPRMARDLRRGQLSLAVFCQNLSKVAWVPLGSEDYFNVNTRQDLESLEGRHVG